VGTAYYGLSVKDCNEEFTACLAADKGERSWASRSLYCQSELRACLGDLAVEAAQEVVSEAGEITQCGRDGLTCYAGADRISAALDCRNGVEVCVNGNVKDLTGIELPTTRQVVGAAVDTAQQVVETAVDTAHQVVHTAVDTAVTVVDTTTTIVENAVQDAVDTAVDVADAVTAPARHAFDCAVQAQQCRRDGGMFWSCSTAYQACLFSAPGAQPAAPAGTDEPGLVLK
jgi:hypothetical protein